MQQARTRAHRRRFGSRLCLNACSIVPIQRMSNIAYACRQRYHAKFRAQENISEPDMNITYTEGIARLEGLKRIYLYPRSCLAGCHGNRKRVNAIELSLHLLRSYSRPKDPSLRTRRKSPNTPAARPDRPSPRAYRPQKEHKKKKQQRQRLRKQQQPQHHNSRYSTIVYSPRKHTLTPCRCRHGAPSVEAFNPYTAEEKTILH